MTRLDEHERPLLPTELRRVVRLRWAAAAAVALGALGSAASLGWTPAAARVLAVAAALAALNAAHHALLRRPSAGERGRATFLAWMQVVPDLVALALLAVWTGGLGSPVLLAFLLHLILTSLLLPPLGAYAAVAAGAAMLFAGLWLSGQWPQGRAQTVTALSFLAAQLLVVYLANHLARSLRAGTRELQRQGRRTRAIVETAADGIITIDQRGIIQSVNPAAERLMGYGAGEMIGRDISMLMPEPFRNEHGGYIERYLRTGEARIIGIGREVTGRRKDGTIVPLDLAVSEVPTDNGRLFTGILRDISERKQAEADLKRLNEELLRGQAALLHHEKMATMGQMAAGVAHEIANPLAGMDSLLQLVIRHPDRLNPATAEALRAQVARLTNLVRRMKDFAHPVETTWETVPVNDLVSGALDLIRFDGRMSRVLLETDFSPEAGTIRVMPDAIRQVIVNLVLNALDATSASAHPRLRLATRRAGSDCIVEVSDNGDGIRPEHLPRVFEPFFTTKPAGQGTGLGLSISSSLIQRHGGRLEVRSTVGEGTCLTIVLPPSNGRESTA